MAVHRESVGVESLCVVVANVLLDFLQSDSTDPAYCVCEIFFNNVLRDSHGLENLCRLVGLDCADSHFRRDFYDSIYDGLVVVVDCGVVVLVQNLLVDKLRDCLVRKIWVDRPCSVAKTHCGLVDITDFRALKDY